MSFLDLYEGDQAQTAKVQPNEGARLPSGFNENFNAAWSDGRMFGQSIARQNARSAVLDDYLSEIKQKTGNDISKDMQGISGPEGGISGTFAAANARVAKMKESYPDLDLDPLSDDEIDKRAVAKAQSAHRDYEALQAGEKGPGGSLGTFAGSAAASAADPLNILSLAVAPETGGSVGVLGSALRWGALAGASQAAIEASSAPFKEQVQPGYLESGQPFSEVAGAAVGGAVLGGGFKALGNAWTRVKTGAWPTSVRDAGNLIESEAHVADTNIFPGVEGEVAHREALTKTIDDVLAGRPVDVSAQVTPEMAAHIEAYHGSPHDFDAFATSKIGTGEGAQSYGHGLYFAENEAVASDYRSKLSANDDAALHFLTMAKNDTRKAEKLYRDTLGAGESPDPSTLRAIAAGPEGTGAVYKVRINADRDKMLDWDKPLSEQSPYVKDVLQKLGMFSDPSMLAKKLVDSMAELKGDNLDNLALDHSLASKKLSDAGIPGIKYLDQGSRAAGEGTRNFVVFNDKDVQITHKNGKPVNAEIRQNVVDKAMGLPPKQPELDLQPPSAEAPKPAKPDLTAPQPPLQTTEQMGKTLTEPAHQEAIRADIDRARAMGDVQVPGVDENGNHTMIGVDKAMDEVDAYKAAAEQIQACANPVQEAAE